MDGEKETRIDCDCLVIGAGLAGLGGMHGYNVLEGTFLGGGIFSDRTAGRAVGR